MSNQHSGHSIVDIYKSVIGDVVHQVKEAFLDDNIDIDVLHQLKKDWEDKLVASGCVDWDGPRPMQPPLSRPVRNMTTVGASHAVSSANAVRLAQTGQHLLVQQAASSQTPQTAVVMQASGNQPSQRIQQVQYVNASGIPVATSDPNAFQQLVQRQQISQAPVQAISSLPSGMIAFQPGQPTRLVHQGGTHQYIMHGAPTSLPPGSSVMILNANGQQIPVTIGTTTMLHPTRIHPAHGQTISSGNDNTSITALDGAGTFTEWSKGSSKTYPSRLRQQEIKSSKIIVKKNFQQLDGLTRLSDSSSDDEDIDEDDEDDPLRRIADHIGEASGNIDDDEQIGEDDPLNSGDDQSDDEDIDKLFQADHLIICQFEKVHRARSKWKFNLKDGIMHIHGKDHCFQRCSGEAEW